MVDMYVKKSELKLISKICYEIIADEVREATERQIAKELFDKVNRRIYVSTGMILLPTPQI